MLISWLRVCMSQLHTHERIPLQSLDAIERGNISELIQVEQWKHLQRKHLWLIIAKPKLIEQVADPALLQSTMNYICQHA